MKGITNRFVLVIIVVVLGGLMIIKLFGSESLFSYQGIHDSTPGFQQYSSGVNLINSFLNNAGSGNGNELDLLIQGKQLLHQAFSKVNDKQLGGLLSGQITKIKTIELIAQTRQCIDLLSSGYQTIGLIQSDYNGLLSGYNIIQQLFASVITTLPTSATKSCLQLYLSGLKGSMDGLTLTYSNIKGLVTNYKSLMTTYQSSWGSCEGIEIVVAHIVSFHQELLRIQSINEQVQKKLQSKNIANYNELCRFGSVQGLTGLVKTSWILNQETKNILPTFTIVTDIKKYIQHLSSGSVLLSGSSATLSWWQSIVQRFQ